MAGNRSRDSAARRDGGQGLAKIQQSRASGKKREPTPKRAAVVVDPRKRLVDGETDPDTKELKPAR
ncbi:MAG: hypothetical protein QM636_12315 [Rhizobium sp.]